MSVSKTILDQLGGSRFTAMTGAHAFVGGSNGLAFSIKARAKLGIKRVNITLRADDTYDIVFLGKAPKDPVFGVSVGLAPKHTVHAIHADQLRPIFRSTTGLETAL